MSHPLNSLVDQLRGKTVAIFGYREDGQLQADYLKHHGVRVVFGIRRDRDEYDMAVRDGQDVVSPEEAARVADVIQVW